MREAAMRFHPETTWWLSQFATQKFGALVVVVSQLLPFPKGFTIRFGLHSSSEWVKTPALIALVNTKGLLNGLVGWPSTSQGVPFGGLWIHKKKHYPLTGSCWTTLAMGGWLYRTGRSNGLGKTGAKGPEHVRKPTVLVERVGSKWGCLFESKPKVFGVFLAGFYDVCFDGFWISVSFFRRLKPLILWCRLAGFSAFGFELFKSHRVFWTGFI